MPLKTLVKTKIAAGTRVVVRADLNVPMLGSQVADDWRLVQSAPTLLSLARRGARVVILSHAGRPNGKRSAKDSLLPVARRLSRIMGKRVAFAADCLGKPAERAVEAVRSGELVLLENLRFHKEEEANDAAFAKRLAAYGDLFVNDAFGACHRRHASIVGIPRYLPSVAGLLCAQEVDHLQRLIRKPKRPFVVLLGGAKIETKIGLIKSLSAVADEILVGGKIAVQLLGAAQGRLGAVRVTPGERALIRKLMRSAPLQLPIDAVVATSAKGKPRHAAISDITTRETLFDIGPQTIRAYASRIRTARTLVWNGPLGLFEVPAFSHGTRALGRLVAARASGRAYGVAGGGETVQALKTTGMQEYMDWVSTGGGAMLAFLEHGTLPGLVPLMRK